jgi:hypothetical protein
MIGFVHLAAILDAWSRRVIGYAIGRQSLLSFTGHPVRKPSRRSRTD